MFFPLFPLFPLFLFFVYFVLVCFCWYCFNTQYDITYLIITYFIVGTLVKAIKLRLKLIYVIDCSALILRLFWFEEAEYSLHCDKNLGDPLSDIVTYRLIKLWYNRHAIYMNYGCINIVYWPCILGIGRILSPNFLL